MKEFIEYVESRMIGGRATTMAVTTLAAIWLILKLASAVIGVIVSRP